MISPLPLFYINLYQRGPHLGIVGAKVRLIISLAVLTFSIWGFWFSVNSWSDGSDLAVDLPDCGEGLGGLVHLSSQAAQGEDTLTLALPLLWLQFLSRVQKCYCLPFSNPKVPQFLGTHEILLRLAKSTSNMSLLGSSNSKHWRLNWNRFCF